MGGHTSLYEYLVCCNVLYTLSRLPDGAIGSFTTEVGHVRPRIPWKVEEL